MLNRTQILQIIDTAYETRIRGDKAALAVYWSPGATYRMAGLAEMLPGFPVGPSEAQPAVHSLIDLVQFHKLEKLDALVDGLRAAVHWQGTFSAPGKPPRHHRTVRPVALRRGRQDRLAAPVHRHRAAEVAARLNGT